MDLDDLFSSKPTDPLNELTRQDLGPLSVDELDARIATLQQEIARVQEHIATMAAHRAQADALFSKR